MIAESIGCIECGVTNETPSHYCVACGAPLRIPEGEGQTPYLPLDSVQLWRTATFEWKNALKSDEVDVGLWGHIASLLSLAITYAGSTPFPRAHAHLAIALLTLGLDAGAEREANIALEQNPIEFRAQQVKVALALGDADVQGDSLSNVLPFRQNREDPEIIPIQEQGYCTEEEIRSTPLDLVAEVEQTLSIFQAFCDANTDVDEYLNIADFLILLGDQLKDESLASLRRDLYKLVAYTPTDKLDCRGRERQVVDILQRSREGLYSLEPGPRRVVARRRERVAAS